MSHLGRRTILSLTRISRIHAIHSKPIVRTMSLYSPMFPTKERVIDRPEVITAAATVEDDSFLGQHGGKVAIACFGAVCALVYRWLENGKNRTKMEKKIENTRVMDPLEADDFNRANSLTL